MKSEKDNTGSDVDIQVKEYRESLNKRCLAT